jgi:uncharacterized protein YuzB (UPF0349 family)
MHKILEFCTNNASHGTDRIMLRFESQQEVDTVEYGCLGNCGQCYMEPFVFVDGDLVSATNPEILYEKILEKWAIEENDPYADLTLDPD